MRHEATSTPGASASTRLAAVLTSAALAVTSCAGGCGGNDSDGRAFVAAEVVGEDPWVDIAEPLPDEIEDVVEEIAEEVGMPGPDAAEPPAPGTDDFVRVQAEAAAAAERAGFSVVPAPTPRGVGLFGGSGANACDVPALIAFLASHPEHARAWSGVLGTDPQGIEELVEGFTAGRLLIATEVINHTLRDGRAVPFPGAVLAAGTAVLVDDNGVPRVRCRCGNPLLPPEGEVTPTATDSAKEEPAVPSEYPDTIRLKPSITEEPAAYPIGLPAALELRLGSRASLTADELEDFPMLTSAVRRSATLTVAEGPKTGVTVDLGEIVVPVGWAPEVLDSEDVASYSALAQGAAEDAAYPSSGTPVADIRSYGSETVAGYRVAGAGGLSVSFPVLGDGAGGLRGVGVVLEWSGPMRCEVVAQPEGFDAAEDCPDKTDDMFWDWGVSNVTFG